MIFWDGSANVISNCKNANRSRTRHPQSGSSIISLYVILSIHGFDYMKQYYRSLPRKRIEVMLVRSKWKRQCCGMSMYGRLSVQDACSIATCDLRTDISEYCHRRAKQTCSKKEGLHVIPVIVHGFSARTDGAGPLGFTQSYSCSRVAQPIVRHGRR